MCTCAYVIAPNEHPSDITQNEAHLPTAKNIEDVISIVVYVLLEGKTIMLDIRKNWHKALT